jgi:cytosine/adenosine deaminase-related metal-dependent hydrolase
MLQELRFAHDYSQRSLGGAISPRTLFEMATSTPARMARIDDKVGSIAVGRYGDLFLLAGRHDDPYEALVRSRTGDVTLVLVGGVPLYGQESHLAALGVRQREPVLVCSSRRALNSAALPAGPLSALMVRLGQSLSGSATRLGTLADCPS